MTSLSGSVVTMGEVVLGNVLVVADELDEVASDVADVDISEVVVEGPAPLFPSPHAAIKTKVAAARPLRRTRLVSFSR